MKLLQQIVKIWSKTPSLETIIKALDKQSQQSLSAIVDGSSNEKNMDVRVAAVMRLSYGSVLLNAATGENKALEKAARSRLSNLLDDKTIEATQLMDEVESKETLLAIAIQCKEHALQNAVLESINDQRQLADICSHSHSAMVRKTLAERIEQPELLRYLLKELKIKDKSAYKIIKQKLSQLKTEDDAVTQFKKNIQRLCDQIQQHSDRCFDKDYTFRLNRLMAQWSDIESNPVARLLIEENQQKNFSANRTLCQQRINDNQQQVDAEKRLSENLSSADNNRQTLLDDFWLYINKLYDLDKLDESVFDVQEKEKEQLMSTWGELLQYGESRKIHNQQYQFLRHTADHILQAYKNKGIIKAYHERITQTEDVAQIVDEDLQYFRMLLEPISAQSYFSLVPPLTDYVITLKDIAKKTSDFEKSEEQQLHLILRLIHQSHAALDKGHLKKALAIRHSVDEKVANLTLLPQRHARQLELLTEALEKMVDWQDYVVEPKKHQLIESMEKLVATSVPVEVLAENIKKLQGEWKMLKQSGDNRQEFLWEKFSQLADEAYAPCKAHYKKLSDERNGNVEKRQQIVEQLNAFYKNNDWENVQWEKVEKILTAAKKEIYRYSPVERISNKAVMESFDLIKQAIQEKIDVKYDSYKKEKEQLVVQAKNITEMNNVEQAISAVKRLQSQWKNIPRGYYKEDKQLWESFRGHCDSVYAKRQALIGENNQRLNDNLEQANILLKNVGRYLELSGADFLSKRKEFSDCKVEYHQIGELPKDAAKKIQYLFSQECEQYEKKLIQEISQLTKNSWQVFFAFIVKLNIYQRALVVDGARSCEVMDDIKLELEQVVHWPEGAKKSIVDKIKNIMPQNKKNELANRDALQLLCIKMEVLTGTSSPEEEQQKRWEYQVKQLQKGAIGTLSVEDESKKLALEWAVVGAVDPEGYDDLYKRFHSCWEKLINKL
jgi:hypothetical protein